MIIVDHQEVSSARGEVGASGSGLCPGELNCLRTVGSDKLWH